MRLIKLLLLIGVLLVGGMIAVSAKIALIPLIPSLSGLSTWIIIIGISSLIIAMIFNKGEDDEDR